MQIGIEPLVIDWAKEEPKMGQIISAYLCLLLIIQFLSRLCNIFFSAKSIALKEVYLMMNFEKIHFTVFKISVKMQI